MDLNWGYELRLDLNSQKYEKEKGNARDNCMQKPESAPEVDNIILVFANNMWEMSLSKTAVPRIRLKVIAFQN